MWSGFELEMGHGSSPFSGDDRGGCGETKQRSRAMFGRRGGRMERGGCLAGLGARVRGEEGLIAVNGARGGARQLAGHFLMARRGGW